MPDAVTPALCRGLPGGLRVALSLAVLRVPRGGPRHKAGVTMGV